MDNKIGKLIAKFRKEKGLTQKELGDKLFVTDKAVSKWERGLSLPDITLFEKLAKELDTDIYNLIGIEKNNKDDVLKVIEEEKIKLKKQFRNRLIIIFVFVLVIVLVFLFKMVSFGYVTKHFRYSNKLINLGVPKFSFLMQNKENNYSFKSFRGKEVLKNEVKYREINRAEANIKIAHFPYLKEIKDFDFDYQPSINKDVINDFTTF